MCVGAFMCCGIYCKKIDRTNRVQIFDLVCFLRLMKYQHSWVILCKISILYNFKRRTT